MKKNMAYILVANMLYLVFGLISSFVLPMFLSVDAYSYLKTYTLYVGYAGVIQFGYADGMYLFYGGKDLKDIESSKISTDINNYVLLNTSIGFIILIISILCNSFLGVIISIGMICDNFLGFFRSLFQAIGAFKNYGLALNIQKISILVFQLLLVFVFKTDNYVYYALVTILVNIGCSFYFFVLLSRKKRISVFSFSLNRGRFIVSQGIVLLIGNFANLLFTSIDRWFIKGFMENLQFAQYSFAVTAESLINALISPVTVTFYNAFCKNNDVEYIKKSKRIAMIIGLLAISAVYPIIWVTNNYLKKYNDSVFPLVLLFAAHAFYAIIKGIYVNLYKVRKQQKKYLFQLIEMVIIAVVLNTLIFYLYRSMNAFAIGTFLTAFIWLIICEFQNKTYRFNFKEWGYLTLLLFVYFATNLFINEIVGFAIYVLANIIMLKVFLPADYAQLISIINDVKKKFIPTNGK